MRRRARAETYRSKTSPTCSEWMQVNCSLFCPGAQHAPVVPWAALFDATKQWRQDGLFRHFFFTRKQPGLRLRFGGPGVEAELEPLVVDWLEHAEQVNLIRGYRFSIYEPEEFRFGGTTGLAIAHDWFDSDTSTIMRYELLSAPDRDVLDRSLVSLVVMNDLITRLVDDTAELWDVWQRLRRALGESQPTVQAPDEALHRVIVNAREYIESVCPGAQDLLDTAFAGNKRIARRLRSSLVAQRLEIGPRQWLTAVCVFHWNRFGFSAGEMRSIVSRMICFLNSVGEDVR